LVLILEIVIAGIAVALIMLSLKTLQAIKHLGVGKSFWMPVAVSGFLFFFGSIIAILFELNYSLTAYTEEVIQVSRLLALCILVSGVYSYSRKVTKNLAEKFTVLKTPDKVNHAVGKESLVVAHVAQAPESPPIQEKIMREILKEDAETRCRYKFGYLRTLPRDAPIPDECLSCDRIIRCKHSLAKTVEGYANSPA
jgi:hypothetical protein